VWDLEQVTRSAEHHPHVRVRRHQVLTDPVLKGWDLRQPCRTRMIPRQMRLAPNSTSSVNRPIIVLADENVAKVGLSCIIIYNTLYNTDILLLLYIIIGS